MHECPNAGPFERRQETLHVVTSNFSFRWTWCRIKSLADKSWLNLRSSLFCRVCADSPLLVSPSPRTVGIEHLSMTASSISSSYVLRLPKHTFYKYVVTAEAGLVFRAAPLLCPNLVQARLDKAESTWTASYTSVLLAVCHRVHWGTPKQDITPTFHTLRMKQPFQ